MIISRLARRYSDYRLLLAGTLLMVVALAGIALTRTWIGIVVFGLLLSVGFSLLAPTFSAQLSRMAEGIQGEAQGLNNSAQSLSRVFGPILFVSMYSWLGTWTPYLLASFLCLLALVIAAARLDPERSLVEAATGDGPVSRR
jgi:predicted MFS family arabinose efflux permease